MNDANATEKGSSCLAITEKKKNNQRPSGGCIGVFFQLFDWNRRLTKKRFFSKKLLPPPARAKQGSSKKFKGDEKMPKSKLHLIANENNGGFPSAKKGGNRFIEVEQKHEMRVPGLVARLMGLESIPASQRDNCKKSNSFSDGDDHTSEADNKQGVDLENGVGVNARHDSRPQKLQKTGAYERRAVTRFGAEGLQIKSVLSQVRKYNHHHHHHHHHPKLVSPLKSPRIRSGKSASRSSRLIEAATKILEPASRAKCSLTSSSTSIYDRPNNNGIVTELVGTRPADIMQNQSGYDASTDTSFMGHTSCENCSNLLEISTPIVSDVFTGSSLESAQKGRSSFIPSHENDVVLLRSQEKIIIVDNEDGKSNAQSCNESTTRKMPVPAKWDSSLQQPCRVLEGDEASSSFAFKHKTQTQENVLSSERTSSVSRRSDMQEKTVSSAASTVSGTKDFVALNRSLGGRTTRTRSPTKVDSCKFDLERKPSNRKDNNSSSRLSNLERKRRTPNVSQVEGGTASVNLVTAKHRNIGSDAQGGKRRNFDASPPNNSNVKSKRGGQLRTDKINDNKVNKVVSSAFSSPLKQKIVIPGGKEETSRDNEIKTFFQRPSPPLRADALGAFLEQKLKELSSRENEELAAGGQPKRSTAMILQELISFLNSEQLTCCDDHMFNDKDHKCEANHTRLLGTSCNGNHLSPGSVLEASFSSSSLDEGLGHGFHPESINYYDQLEQLENDAELLDSAASFNKGKKIGCVILTELVNQIHRMLQSISSFWTRMTESKLNHMKEVIFNAELVIGNVTDGVPQLLISCFLLNELDKMASSDAMWRDFFNGFVGCEEPKNRSQQLKGFLFDCVIEYLESNCCQHYNSIFKSWSAWTRLPLCAKAEVLAQEVKSEIKKWACIAGNMVPDQIIEWEMSHSLGKWNDFNVEAFEAGVDIDGDVLQILVDEIVEDLVDSRPRSCY